MPGARTLRNIAILLSCLSVGSQFFPRNTKTIALPWKRIRVNERKSASVRSIYHTLISMSKHISYTNLVRFTQFSVFVRDHVGRKVVVEERLWNGNSHALAKCPERLTQLFWEDRFRVPLLPSTNGPSLLRSVLGNLEFFPTFFVFIASHQIIVNRLSHCESQLLALL